jgi:hypothetical protein
MTIESNLHSSEKKLWRVRRHRSKVVNFEMEDYTEKAHQIALTLRRFTATDRKDRSGRQGNTTITNRDHLLAGKGRRIRVANDARRPPITQQ